MDAWTPPKRVRVPGRDEIAEVLQWGKNVGATPAVYCAVLYFRETGECCFYAIDRLTRVE